MPCCQGAAFSKETPSAIPFMHQAPCLFSASQKVKLLSLISSVVIGILGVSGVITSPLGLGVATLGLGGCLFLTSLIVLPNPEKAKSCLMMFTATMITSVALVILGSCIVGGVFSNADLYKVSWALIAPAPAVIAVACVDIYAFKD